MVSKGCCNNPIQTGWLTRLKKYCLFLELGVWNQIITRATCTSVLSEIIMEKPSFLFFSSGGFLAALGVLWLVVTALGLYLCCHMVFLPHLSLSSVTSTKPYRFVFWHVLFIFSIGDCVLCHCFSCLALLTFLIFSEISQ